MKKRQELTHYLKEQAVKLIDKMEKNNSAFGGHVLGNENDPDHAVVIVVYMGDLKTAKSIATSAHQFANPTKVNMEA